MPQNVDDIKARHAAATTHEERAALEELAWCALSGEERKRYHSLPHFAHDVFGVKHRDSNAHQRLRHFGAAGAPVWQRFDGPERMTAHSVMRVTQRARELMRLEALDAEDAIATALKEYDALPMRKLRNGTTVRAGRRKGAVTQSRDEWAAVRLAVKSIIDRRLRDVDEATRTVLQGQIEAELSLTIKTLSARIARAKAAPTDVNVDAARRRLRQACLTLAVDTPRYGDRIDAGKAKKNFRRLALQHHPDRGGNRDEYEAVVEAYNVIEAYNDNLKQETQQHGGNQHG